MLLTEAILSRTVDKTNYVLEKEISYGDGIPALVFNNALTDDKILFYMEYNMTPEVRLVQGYDTIDIFSLKSNQNRFFDTIRYLSHSQLNANPEDAIARGIIILGQLCEIVCKAGMPVTMIVDNLELFEKFIKESLEFYGYSERYYDFSLTNTLDLLQIGTDKEVNIPYPTTTLLCQMEDLETRCIGYLSIRDYKVSLGIAGSAEYTLEVPDVFPIENFDSNNPCKKGYMIEKVYISSYLAYILLAFTGFYFNRDCLHNFAISSKEDLEGCNPESFSIQDYLTADLYNLAKSLEEVNNL